MGRHSLRQLGRILAVAILAWFLVRFITSIADPSHGNSAKFRPKRDSQDSEGSVLLNGSLGDAGQSETDANGLVKRILYPDCTQQQFVESRHRGCTLRNAQFQSTVYPIATVQDLHDSGWVLDDVDVNTDMTTVAPFLRDLAGVEEYPLNEPSRRVMLRQGEYVSGTWNQWFSYNAPGGGPNQLPATLGSYRQISAPREGVIVILDAWSPAHMSGLPNAQLPRVHTWQQVGQAEYGNVFQSLTAAGTTNSRPARIPNWILIKTVNHPLETLGVISRCLWTDHNLLVMPDWEHRVTFPIGTACFDALLGTQNAMPVGWQIIMKRSTWRACILSITIFDSGVTRNDGVNFPSMLFYIQRSTQVGLFQRHMGDNERFQAQADRVPRVVFGRPPHPMGPIYR